jgi:hypothetical protein
MSHLDFDTLYIVEHNISEMKKIIKTKDLTPSVKEAILQLSARQVSSILEMYWWANNRKIDYKNKKVYLDENITLDYNYYEDYIKSLRTAYNDCADIQKAVLGTDEYNKIVYAQS